MADDGGLARFQARMKAIPKAVKDAVKPALRDAGNETADTMERFAPQDTGKLKGSIAVTLPGRMTPPYSQPGGSRVAGELEVVVTAGDSDVRYAHLVEYGHKGPKGAEVQAQPFFWPGFRLTRKRSANRIKSAVARAVRKNWGKK